MIMTIVDQMYLSFVVAGSSEGVRFSTWEMELPSRPRFGRNWWYWVPSFSTNGGNFKRDKCTDVNLHWLCFIMSFTWYR
jgi:hypothetical protein